MHSSLFETVGYGQRRVKVDYSRLGEEPSSNWGVEGALGEILPGLLCTVWTLALLLWTVLA